MTTCADLSNGSASTTFGTDFYYDVDSDIIYLNHVPPLWTSTDYEAIQLTFETGKR